MYIRYTIKETNNIFTIRSRKFVCAKLYKKIFSSGNTVVSQKYTIYVHMNIVHFYRTPFQTLNNLHEGNLGLYYFCLMLVLTYLSLPFFLYLSFFLFFSLSHTTLKIFTLTNTPFFVPPLPFTFPFPRFFLIKSIVTSSLKLVSDISVAIPVRPFQTMFMRLYQSRGHPVCQYYFSHMYFFLLKNQQSQQLII